MLLVADVTANEGTRTDVAVVRTFSCLNAILLDEGPDGVFWALTWTAANSLNPIRTDLQKESVKPDPQNYVYMIFHTSTVTCRPGSPKTSLCKRPPSSSRASMIMKS